MLRSVGCRPFLQRLQQHGTRSFRNSRIRLLPQNPPKDLNQHNHPESNLGAPGNPLAQQRKSHTVSLENGNRRKKRPPGTVLGTIQKELEKLYSRLGKDQVDEEWAQVFARDRIDRQREWNFLKNFRESDRPRWREWRRNLASLVEFMATRGSSKVPTQILTREHIERAINEWPSWTSEQKRRSWHELVLSAPWSCPDRMVDILELAMQDCEVPGYILSDSIHFLARWQTRLGKERLKAHAESLCDFTIVNLRKSSDGRARLRQNTIYNLTKNVGPERVVGLHQSLLEMDHPMHHHTLLSIARQLADHQSHKQAALDIVITAIRDTKADLGKPSWLSVCTAILSVTPEGARVGPNFTAADAFSLLLEHGFEPNMVSYTALIRSLCVSGDPDTAWRIFEIMKQRNIEPDPKLYSTLLHGAKKVFSGSTINHVAEEAAGRNAVDAVFLNDMLSSILHFSEAEMREKKRKKQDPAFNPAFGPMLVFYARAFWTAPLQALIPTNLAQYAGSRNPRLPDGWERASHLFPGLEVATSTVKEKLEPTDATLSIMFIAYVKSLSQPIQIISLYAYFRQQVLNHNPVAVRHIQEKGTFIYDVILKSLLECPGMLRPALDILGDMLKDTLQERAKNDASLSVTAAVSEPPLTLHPPPSIYTWNIILAGLLFAREQFSANEISSMMNQHGIQRNDVTWNTLVTGYAGLQNVGQTVKALQGLERAGYEADNYTLRGFSRLVNKQKAFLLMEQKINKLEKVKGRKPTAVNDGTNDIGNELVREGGVQ